MTTERAHNPTLAAAIAARMDELGLSVQDVVDEAGITRQGLQPLLAGEIRTYQKRLTTPVCRALGWSPDSIKRLLAGDRPIVLGDNGKAATKPSTEPTMEQLELKLDLLLQALERLSERVEANSVQIGRLRSKPSSRTAR